MASTSSDEALSAQESEDERLIDGSEDDEGVLTDKSPQNKSPDQDASRGPTRRSALCIISVGFLIFLAVFSLVLASSGSLTTTVDGKELPLNDSQDVSSEQGQGGENDEQTDTNNLQTNIPNSKLKLSTVEVNREGIRDLSNAGGGTEAESAEIRCILVRLLTIFIEEHAKIKNADGTYNPGDLMDNHVLKKIHQQYSDWRDVEMITKVNRGEEPFSQFSPSFAFKGCPISKIESLLEEISNDPFLPSESVEFLNASVLHWDFSAERFQVKELEDDTRSTAIFAFAFGPGEKVGAGRNSKDAAEDTDTSALVGPGFDSPGPMNMGLALEIKRLIEITGPSVPVFLQWEIADALLCGSQKGCPLEIAETFSRWEFAHNDINGDENIDDTKYARIAEYEIEEGKFKGQKTVIFKSLPPWPKLLPVKLKPEEHLMKHLSPEGEYTSKSGRKEFARVAAHIKHDMDVNNGANYYLSTPICVKQWQEYYDQGLVAKYMNKVKEDNQKLVSSSSSGNAQEESTGSEQRENILPSRIIVVGHTDHSHRCRLVVDRTIWYNTDNADHQELDIRLSPKEMATKQDEWKTLNCDKNGYDPRSSQPWCHSRGDYLLHEVKCRTNMNLGGI